MSRKNIELYRKKAIQVDKNQLNTTVRSQLEASVRYDKTVDIVKLRLPKGYKSILKDIATSNNTSVNALLVQLIQENFDL